MIFTAGCAANQVGPGQQPGAAPSASQAAPSASQAPAGPVTPEPRSKPVAPPAGPGNAKKVVPAGAQETLPPVPTEQPAEVEGRIRVELLELRRDQVKANAPGEISGPAVRVRVKITNTSDTALDLDRSTVAVTNAAKSPLSPVQSDPVGALRGSLASANSAEGTYIFSTADSRGPLSILVSAAAGTPAAQFVGEPA